MLVNHGLVVAAKVVGCVNSPPWTKIQDETHRKVGSGIDAAASPRKIDIAAAFGVVVFDCASTLRRSMLEEFVRWFRDEIACCTVIIWTRGTG